MKDFFEGYKTSKVVIEEQNRISRESFYERVIEWDGASSYYYVIDFLKRMFTTVETKGEPGKISFMVKWNVSWVYDTKSFPCLLLNEKGIIIADSGIKAMMHLYDLNPLAAIIALNTVR